MPEIQFPVTCDACGDDIGIAYIDQAKETEYSATRFLCMECVDEPEGDEKEGE